ncbi:MAG: hypothetical protein KUG73_00375 [Pseudomonadales bacterium]|nr:hypothetical protein [Pseudomonadales bacterium]
MLAIITGASVKHTSKGSGRPGKLSAINNMDRDNQSSRSKINVTPATYVIFVILVIRATPVTVATGVI